VVNLGLFPSGEKWIKNVADTAKGDFSLKKTKVIHGYGK